MTYSEARPSPTGDEEIAATEQPNNRNRCDYPTCTDTGGSEKLCAVYDECAEMSGWQMRVLMTVIKVALIDALS